MELTWVQKVSLVITLLATVLPGIIAVRKVCTADDYNVGGRSAGSTLVAGGIIGTIIGGSATVGTAQMGFKLGLTAWWFTLGAGIAFIIMAVFYARPLRNSGLTTISEFLVLNFGKGAGPIASLASTVGIFFSIAASTLTGIHLIAGIFQVDVVSAALIMIAVILGLVFFGGINSSGMAGVLKIVLVFSTIFVGGIFSYLDMGGWNGITVTFSEAPWFSLFANGIQDALVSLVAMIIGVISTQTYVQALFSAKNSETAARGCIIAALVVIPVGLPSVMIGMFMKTMHPEINGIDALPLYLCTYLPEWLGGAGIAALVISALGSIAGLALGVGTMISRDIFKALLGVKSSNLLLWINRLSVLTVTVMAVLFVFQNMNALVLEWNYLSMALRGAGIFLPLTFIVLFKNRLPHWAGIGSMLSGVVVACLWDFFMPAPANALFPSLIANLIFLIPGVIIGKK